MELKVNKKEAKNIEFKKEDFIKELQVLSVGGYKNATNDVDVVKTKHLIKLLFLNLPPIFDINDAIPNTDFTPLMCATWTEQNKVIRLLLKAGAQPVGNDKGLPSVLHIAVAKHREDMLAGYIEYFPEVINHQDKNGTTALMLSAELNDPLIMRILLDAGANLYLKNENGETAYDIAEKKFNNKSMEWLRHKELQMSMQRETKPSAKPKKI